MAFPDRGIDAVSGHGILRSKHPEHPINNFNSNARILHRIVRADRRLLSRGMSGKDSTHLDRFEKKAEGRIIK